MKRCFVWLSVAPSVPDYPPVFEQARPIAQPRKLRIVDLSYTTLSLQWDPAAEGYLPTSPPTQTKFRF